MQFTYQQGGIAWLFLLQLSYTPQVPGKYRPLVSFPRATFIDIHTYLRDVVLPTVPYLTLGEKHADRQTFPWKV